MTLQTRPVERSDAAQIIEILNETEAAEPADQFWDLDEVEELMGESTTDLPRGTVALLEGDLMVAFGMLQLTSPSEVWKAYALGGVRTAYREQGVGRRVLETLAERARAIRDTHDPGKPGELRVWAPERRVRTVRLASALGYETWRYFQDMRHDLADLPAVPSIDGIEIRPWAAELDEQTRLASNESFADHWGSSPQDATHWRELFADASMFRPTPSMLALDDQGVVGFVLVEEFAAESAARGYRTGYIARVGTVRRARGRGVAGALIAGTLRQLKDEGYAVAELNVDSASRTGAGRLYERLGFTPTHLNLAMGIRF